MTHPNQDIVRQASAAFGSGDLGALHSQYLAENVVWHVAGRGPLAGDYQGIAQVIALFGKISELSGGTARFELHDVAASDQHTVSLATITAQRAGKRYQDNLVHVVHVQDGKATEVWTHAADPFAAQEFWCPGAISTAGLPAGADRTTFLTHRERPLRLSYPRRSARAAASAWLGS